MTLPPSSKEVSLTDTVGVPRAGATTRDTGPTATVSPLESVTATVTQKDPAADGVQESVGKLLAEHPGGSPLQA